MKKFFFCTMIMALQYFLFAAPGKGGLSLTPGETRHRLFVSFKYSVSARSDDNGILYSKRKTLPSDLQEFINREELSFSSVLKLSEEAIDKIEKASMRSDKELDLGGILEITMKNYSNKRLLKIAKELEAKNYVRYCEITPTTVLPEPPSIQSQTPDYTPYQNYVQGAPGINASYAHDLGLTGAGIRIADIEYSWNYNHEEFVAENIKSAPDVTEGTHGFDFNHGTAVAGIIYAGDNNFGMRGLAYGAESFVCYPETSVEGEGWNRPYALGKALEQLNKGDIMLYEIQYRAEETNWNYVPAEYQKTVWDLTRALCDKGIIVVATGSNGNQDMDTYTEYMGWGDSGAIMVGAGSSTTQEKLSFSTYGSRFNVQAWGEKVSTTGHWYGNAGELMVDNDINRDYCTHFAGTSSAGPLVAGGVALIQEYAIKYLGKTLSSEEMRTLVESTGIPQPDSAANGKIGPLLNVKAAIEKLQSENDLCVGFHNITEDSNDNSVLETGESAKINFIATNHSSSSENVTILVSVTENQHLISIDNSEVNLGTLSSKEHKSGSCNINVSNSASDVDTVTFKFAIKDTEKYSTKRLALNPKSTISFSLGEVVENKKNDGQVDLVTHLFLKNDRFSKEQGSFIYQDDFHFQDLPTGLSASMEVLGEREALVTIYGKAENHVGEKNIKLVLEDQTLKSGSASNIINKDKEVIKIKFRSPYQIQRKNLDLTCNSSTTWNYFDLEYGNAKYGTLYNPEDNYGSQDLRIESYAKRMVGKKISGSQIDGIQFLDENSLIGPDNYWSSPNGSTLRGILILSSNIYTDWNGKTGYAGIEINNEYGETCYGWLKIVCNSDGTEFSIKEAAYNEQPEASIYAGTSTSEIEENAATSNKDFELFRNYPNPFNPTTNISFSINKDSHLNLEVFNIKGQVVAKLLEGNYPKGNYHLKFDGSKLNSGVYYYRLKLGNHSSTRKMILLK